MEALRAEAPSGYMLPRAAGALAPCVVLTREEAESIMAYIRPLSSPENVARIAALLGKKVDADCFPGSGREWDA